MVSGRSAEFLPGASIYETVDRATVKTHVRRSTLSSRCAVRTKVNGSGLGPLQERQQQSDHVVWAVVVGPVSGLRQHFDARVGNPRARRLRQLNRKVTVLRPPNDENGSINHTLRVWTARPTRTRVADIKRTRSWPFLAWCFIHRRVLPDLDLLVSKTPGAIYADWRARYADDIARAASVAERFTWSNNWTHPGTPSRRSSDLLRAASLRQAGQDRQGAGTNARRALGSHFPDRDPPGGAALP